MHSSFTGNSQTPATLILYQSNVTMYNTTFADNKQADAGGISITGGSLQILASNFEANQGNAAIVIKFVPEIAADLLQSAMQICQPLTKYTKGAVRLD